MEPISNIDLSALTPEQLNALVAVAVSAGTLYCFLGYRTLKFIIALTGFLLAGTVAAVLTGWLTEGHVVSMAIIGLLGGISGAMALFFLYKAGIFLLGLLAATLCAHNVLSGYDAAWAPIAVIGIGVIGGLFALFIERPVIMAATAAIGAWMVISGVIYYLAGAEWLEEWRRSLELQQEKLILLAAWALLAALGAYAQFATRPRHASKPA